MTSMVVLSRVSEAVAAQTVWPPFASRVLSPGQMRGLNVIPGDALLPGSCRAAMCLAIAARWPGLLDDEHAVAARDQFPDHRRSRQLPGHEQPARCLRVREQEQVFLAYRVRVGVREHPFEVPPAPAG